jgi:hypothetical protein
VCDHHQHHEHHQHHQHHQHHEHHHGPGPEETGAIWFIIESLSGLGSLQEKAQTFTSQIHLISSPVDLWENNVEFRKALEGFGIQLRWGRKASRFVKHAYVLPFGDGEGEVYTIQTDLHLHLYETGVFPWKSYDLFEEDQ